MFAILKEDLNKGPITTEISGVKIEFSLNDKGEVCWADGEKLWLAPDEADIDKGDDTYDMDCAPGKQIQFLIVEGEYVIDVIDKPVAVEVTAEAIAAPEAPKVPEIKVLRVQNSTKPGNIVAFFDFRIGEVTIRGAKLMKSFRKTGEYFISVPSRKGANGHWYPIVKTGHMTEVLAAVMAEPKLNKTSEVAAAPAELPFEMISADTAIAELLHQNPAEIKGAKLQSYSNGHVKVVVINGRKYMTQNPNKTSEFAERARKGVKITWVLDNAGKFVGRVEDGKYFPL